MGNAKVVKSHKVKISKHYLWDYLHAHSIWFGAFGIIAWASTQLGFVTWDAFNWFPTSNGKHFVFEAEPQDFIYHVAHGTWARLEPTPLQHAEMDVGKRARHRDREDIDRDIETGKGLVYAILEERSFQRLGSWRISKARPSIALMASGTRFWAILGPAMSEGSDFSIYGTNRIHSHLSPSGPCQHFTPP